jgi:hypothetical protein
MLHLFFSKVSWNLGHNIPFCPSFKSLDLSFFLVRALVMRILRHNFFVLQWPENHSEELHTHGHPTYGHSAVASALPYAARWLPRFDQTRRQGDHIFAPLYCASAKMYLCHVMCTRPHMLSLWHILWAWAHSECFFDAQARVYRLCQCEKKHLSLILVMWSVCLIWVNKHDYALPSSRKNTSFR